MPFGEHQIEPNSLNPRRGLGVSLPFNQAGVFGTTYVTRDAIRNNVLNFFLSEPGERPFRPDFGGGLRRFIFEQSDNQSAEDVERHIAENIALVFPNIEITDLQILRNPDFNQVVVQLRYDVANTNISDEIEITFS